MDCSEATAALAAAREGPLPPDRERALHAHLALCQACRAAWASQEHIRPLADDGGPPGLPPAFSSDQARVPGLQPGSPATSPDRRTTPTNPVSTADPAWPARATTPPGDANPETLPPPPPHPPRPARPPIRRLSPSLPQGRSDLLPLPNVSGALSSSHTSPDASPHPPPGTVPGEPSPANPEAAGPRDFSSWTDTLGWLLVCVLGLWVLFGGGGTPGPTPTGSGPTSTARTTPDPAPASPGPGPTAPQATPTTPTPETASRRVFQVGEAMVMMQGDAQVAVLDDTLTIFGGKGKVFLVSGRRAVLRLGSSTPVLREQPFEFDLPPASLPVVPPASPIGPPPVGNEPRRGEPGRPPPGASSAGR